MGKSKVNLLTVLGSLGALVGLLNLFAINGDRLAGAVILPSGAILLATGWTAFHIIEAVNRSKQP